jgi:protein tyrosine phosphatase (PTP) superfamily phosphohydrolase (DUF442 family)
MLSLSKHRKNSFSAPVYSPRLRRLSDFRLQLYRCLAAVLFFALPAHAQQSKSVFNPAEIAGKVEAPVVLCIDDKPTVGGQPSTSAYAKAAANGFRSVLTLRSPADGVDINRERFMVEQSRMRYFNIPSTGKLPQRKQIDEFLTVVRDKANHPMLLNCAFAERVAPFLMIFRIKEQGWSEKRAVKEGASSGLKPAELQKFARDYFAASKKPVR